MCYTCVDNDDVSQAGDLFRYRRSETLSYREKSVYLNVNVILT